MTRMNRTALLAAGLFGLTVCAVMLVARRPSDDDSPYRSLSPPMASMQG